MSTNKEMNIVFVYDRERCVSEEDDPISAVAYFHPSWVSDAHRLTLCGQLMGVAQFLNLNFCEARTIVLQSGKFILTPFGRFILVVGTDRNISDSALTHRSDLLATVVRLYHRSLETVYEHCMSISSNYKTVTDKFYHIFETYLPLLQHQSSVFNSVPTLKIPQSANCVFVEAIQTLQDCRQLKGVLGGTILYHNKIVSTQLPSQVSKTFVLTDPYRIKTTAAQLSVPYHVPVGVQLVSAYMSRRDFQKLRNDSQRAFSLQNSSFVQNGGVLPFQFKRKPRRDKSSLFSNIPEEETHNGPFSENEEVAEHMKHRNNGTAMRPRPTHLPLRMKNETTREVPDSGTSITFDETDSYPQFYGTTVLSTPLLENKVLPGSLSLFGNQAPRNHTVVTELKEEADEKEEKEEEEEQSQQVPPSEETQKKKNALEKFSEMTFENIRGNTLKALNRSPSLRPIVNLFAKDTAELLLKRPNGKPKFQTITDPSYPVFNDEGLPISQFMFDQCGIELGVDIAQDVESLKIDGFPTESEVETMDNDDERVMETEKPTENGEVVNQNEVGEGATKANGQISSIDEIVFRKKPNGTNAEKEEKRKSLTLPIQAINLEPLGDSIKSPVKEEDDDLGDTFADRPVKRVRPDFPVTPLMSKIIAQFPFDSTWSSGFSSSTLTPVMTPIDCNKAFMRRRSSITKVNEEVEEEEERLAATDLQKIELFVCGQHNMTMLIAMEENSGQGEELVQTLWEKCISRLPKIESNLLQTLNVNVDGVVDKNDMNYSFMCFDPSWDVIQQGGHWTTAELQVLEDLHADFKENSSFTETLVRCNDSVIYGYRCGDMEVYYKQPANQLRGIAQPGDGMGNAPLNAKRRLERDHSIILL